MRIKTAELDGAALAWAVAKCRGYSPQLNKVGDGAKGVRVMVPAKELGLQSSGWVWYRPHIDQAQGGPILDEAVIGVVPEDRDGTVWKAQFSFCREVLFTVPMRLAYSYCTQRGGTRLVAGMRCYVTQFFGDLVGVPEELT